MANKFTVDMFHRLVYGDESVLARFHSDAGLHDSEIAAIEARIAYEVRECERHNNRLKHLEQLRSEMSRMNRISFDEKGSLKPIEIPNPLPYPFS